mmetsp:Transcript_75712/g.195095  ORF Transcript_75712/g.195095 Transcript_75712/m.195095 type:complete len:754 (+) Transcript_75712:29-2290(+)
MSFGAGGALMARGDDGPQLAIPARPGEDAGGWSYSYGYGAGAGGGDIGDHSPEERPRAHERPALSQLRPTPLGALDEPPMRTQSHQPRVYIHACGRLETVQVDRVALSEVAMAARMAFDFPRDQEMILVGKDGALVTTDEQLRRLQSHSETVYVRLSDGAFHDFERRIDQIQHMQIGYLCDQLATFRQEHTDLHMEIKNLRQALDQEQAARENGDEVVRRQGDELRSFSHRLQSQGDERLEAFDTALYDVRQGLREEALAREQVAQDGLRSAQELRELLGAEGKAREHADERLRFEVEETRRALQLEVTDREECEVRAERGLRDLREAISDAAEASTAEAAEVRRQLLDAKQAIAVEQRERLSGDADLATTAKELRAALQSEVRDRTNEDLRVAKLCSEVETTAEAERLARQKIVADLSQQLGEIVESIQEEQTLRSSEDAELSAMVESLRRFVDDARKRLDEAELQAAKTVHDLSKGLDREAQVRDDEVGKLMRILAEERDGRQETEGKVGRAIAALREHVTDEAERRARDSHEVAQRTKSLYVSLQAEQKDRTSAVDDVSERISQLRRRLNEMAGLPADAAGEGEERGAGSIFERERQERNSAVNEVRELIMKEAQAREKGDMALSRSVAAAREAIEDIAAKPEGDSKGSSTEVAAIKEGLTKVVEAVQQERQKRTEGDNKLREDCVQAIQNEINARLEHDRKVEEELESERQVRQEVVEAIQLAIEECRHGLETHTHEFDMDHEEGGSSA